MAAFHFRSSADWAGAIEYWNIKTHRRKSVIKTLSLVPFYEWAFSFIYLNSTTETLHLYFKTHDVLLSLLTLATKGRKHLIQIWPISPSRSSVQASLL